MRTFRKLLKHQLLIELKKIFIDVDTADLVAYEVFRKGFHSKLNIFEFKLEILCNISKVYPYL